MTMTTPLRSPESATSADGRHYQTGAIHPKGSGDDRIVVLGAFQYPGTTSSPPRVLHVDSTSSGPPTTAAFVPVGQTTAEAVLELRRRSGLTWELLSELFNVPRRTVHHWANGKAPSAQHEWEIRRTLGAVRYLDEGESRKTRDRLLTPVNGLSPFDLLAERRYADVRRQTAATGSPGAGRRHAALSEDERARRRPPPPILLLDAIGERPDVPVGKARIALPARKKNPTG